MAMEWLTTDSAELRSWALQEKIILYLRMVVAVYENRSNRRSTVESVEKADFRGNIRIKSCAEILWVNPPFIHKPVEKYGKTLTFNLSIKKRKFLFFTQRLKRRNEDVKMKKKERVLVMEFEIIAHVRSDFKEKFGIPRQSGLVPGTISRIVFDEAYRNREALRGIEGFSHLWLIWVFSANRKVPWSPTVRPPRLGGNRRMGVFSTRSPYRPNPIGLSCVRLKGIEETEEGPVLVVGGADLMDGTPILDIKPYLPYADRIENATGGFTDDEERRNLSVVFPEELERKVNPEKMDALKGLLAQDPRPSYQKDENRIYGVSFSKQNIKFCVKGEELTVIEVEDE